MFNKKAQSTLEYVLILTAVIAAIIVAAKVLNTKVNTNMQHVATQMENEVTKIKF